MYNTPLTAAVIHGDVHNIRLLLQFKADVNLGTHSGVTALMSAANRGEKQIFELLLENKASVTQCDELCGRTALHWCCRYDVGDREECVKLLLQYKSDVMHTDKYGKTALHYCCMYGTGDIEECVKLLLQYKSDVMHTDNEGKTPVDYAKQNGYTNIVHILQQHGK